MHGRAITAMTDQEREQRRGWAFGRSDGGVEIGGIRRRTESESSVRGEILDATGGERSDSRRRLVGLLHAADGDGKDGPREGVGIRRWTTLRDRRCERTLSRDGGWRARWTGQGGRAVIGPRLQAVVPRGCAGCSVSREGEPGRVGALNGPPPGGLPSQVALTCVQCRQVPGYLAPTAFSSVGLGANQLCGWRRQSACPVVTGRLSGCNGWVVRMRRPPGSSASRGRCIFTWSVRLSTPMR